MKLPLDFIQLQNVPYKINGRNLEEGLDCYGFVVWAYSLIGIKLPDIGREVSLDEWGSQGFRGYLKEFVDKAILVEGYPIHGDILLIQSDEKMLSHIGIMWDGESFVHFWEGRGFSKSPFKTWKVYIESVWRLKCLI